MNPSTAIRVDRLSKRYRLGARDELHDTLAQTVLSWLASPLTNLRRLRRLTRFDDDGEDVLWALRDVSFEVASGEVVGIIGRNGAGKSTLLKILSSITEPTSGRAEIDGEVSSLLEVGTGFHPELTGRENVYLNGTILGMTRRQIDRRFSAITDFAGIDRFLDTPVKRYSSGMRVRLAFAVAAHLEPKVLLIDEVLAVGDSAFQAKCLGKMREVASGGRTVLFVSHNLSAVSALCSRCVLLDQGEVARIGLTDEVIAEYLATSMSRPEADLAQRTDRSGNGRLRIIGIDLLDADDRPIPAVQVGQTVRIALRYRASDRRALRDVTFSFSLRDHLGSVVTTCWTESTGESFDELPATGVVACDISAFPLLPGRYSVSFSVKSQGAAADQMEEALTVTVVPGDFFGTGGGKLKQRGVMVMPHRWSLHKPAAAVARRREAAGP